MLEVSSFTPLLLQFFLSSLLIKLLFLYVQASFSHIFLSDSKSPLYGDGSKGTASRSSKRNTGSTYHKKFCLNMRVRLDKLLAFRLSAISHRRNSHVLYPSLLCWAASWSPQSTEEGRLRRDTPFQHMLSLHPSHYQRSVQWCSGFTTPPSSSSRLPATSAFKLCANSITSTAKCLENFPCNTKTHHKLARPENDSRMSIEESMHHDLCFIES